MLTSMRGLLAATLLAGSSFAAMPAMADETDPPSAITITGSAAIVSQYRFRGLAQSDNKPAVQAAITLKHESGFYISTWGSSTAGDTTAFASSPIQPGGTEIDVYGGYSHGFGAVTVDVGGYGYLYPNATINNYYEIYGSLATTMGPVTAKAGVNYAPGQNYFKDYAVTNHNLYVFGELSGGVPGVPITLHGHVGYTDGGLRYIKNYVDYTVGASYTWKMLTLDASLVGTNISDRDVVTGTSCLPSCNYWKRPAKMVGVVSLTASF
ncbi:MAG: TorF family putative porin [Novosphingobium sp.]